MSFRFALIPKHSVVRTFGARLDLLERLAAETEGRASPDSIMQVALQGNVMVWVLYFDGAPVGFMTALFTPLEMGKAFRIVDAVADTGTMEAAGELVQSTLETYAKVSECRWIEFEGRRGWRGWARKAGYDERRVIYVKEV